jgi:hypothetical protein
MIARVATASTAPVPDRVRSACARVAAESRFVRIEADAVEEYARTLAEQPPTEPDPRTQLLEGGREQLAAFAICLDAINFGSGWWPTIVKRDGLSGYGTIAAGVTDHFRDGGAWTARDLVAMDAATIAAVVRQDPGHPLMAQFAAALRDVGVHLRDEHGGSFERLVEAAAGSAVALAGRLAEWEAFADVSLYRGRPVPFFKRAQLAAADVDRAGVASFPDLHRLTAFADNLVPHVLRIDGVLRLDADLERSIEAGALLVHGSPEEVELRAGAVHAIELLVAATGGRLSAAQIDATLWNRGREPRYKAVPRPRSRNTAY